MGSECVRHVPADTGSVAVGDLDDHAGHGERERVEHHHRPGSSAAAIAAATTSYSLFQTGQHFEEPLNQLDLRLSKRFSLRTGQRLLLNVDLYNAFNNAWVYTQNGTLGTNYTIATTWLRPGRRCGPHVQARRAVRLLIHSPK